MVAVEAALGVGLPDDAQHSRLLTAERVPDMSWLMESE